MFSIRECIYKTKNRMPLSETELQGLVQAVTTDAVPDYQLSAWLMAVRCCGLTDTETAILTAAMRDSGQVLHWNLPGKVVDKHSTGGVGDKTTLILAPILAACGAYMPKMSGKGLGHTGGTIDKLESIPGLTTNLSPERFLALTKEVGCAVAMQSGNLAPADKKLYALRDVTETVDSIPLICASIMSKKLATGADHILLDVKVGSGAFMKTKEDAAELARLMLHAAKADGKQCTAMLTDMDMPLGTHVGNALEVREALSVLRGDHNTALGHLCKSLATELLVLADLATPDTAMAQVEQALSSGAALERFAKMIAGQGGDARITEEPERLTLSRCSRVLCAPESGYIAGINSETIGRGCVQLGAGRQVKTDAIDYGAGVVLAVNTGDAIQKGEPLLTMYADTEAKLDATEPVLRAAYRFSATPIERQPDILGIYSTKERNA